ncbi:hypothetical protein BH20ACI2_BH20ACI2_28300 [soil metagenome]
MPNKIFITEKKSAELRSFRVESGDIIISRSGTVGEICRVPDSMANSIISTNLIKVSLNQTSVNPKFFVYLFQGGTVRQQVFDLCKGSSRAFLNQTILSTLDFPYCSLDEQQRIVEEIESRLSVCDKLEESIQTSLKQSEALRQSILKQAFEGKLVQQVAEPKTRQPNEQFERIRVLAFILKYLASKGFRPKQMASAKYVYLIEKIFGVPIYKKYRRLHLGPYSPEIKKNIFNRTYFSHTSRGIDVLNGDKLFKYPVPNRQLIETAIDEIAATFSKYNPSERSHKVELLATVCKVIEDVGSTDLSAIRQSMSEWPIELPNSKYKNKAEKFNEAESGRCVKFWVMTS